jgi:hypothetical protein
VRLPVTIFRAVMLRPKTSLLASSSGRSDVPSSDIPAKRPRDREELRISERSEASVDPSSEEAQPLRAMPEAALERLEPAHQSLNPRGGGAIDHRAAHYRNYGIGTMSSYQITQTLRKKPRDLTR